MPGPADPLNRPLMANPPRVTNGVHPTEGGDIRPREVRVNRMRVAMLTLPAMLCALHAPSRATDRDGPLALRLVSIMGIDLQMALGVRSIGEQMYRTGQLDAE